MASDERTDGHPEPVEEHEEPHEPISPIEHRRGTVTSTVTNDDASSHTSSHHEEDDHKDVDAEQAERPAVARASSQYSMPIPVVKVPRRLRTGPLARFTILYEAEDPYNYPRRLKWVITFWIGLAAVTAPLGSSIILPNLGDIKEDFNSNYTVTNLSIALYMLSMSVFPLWWSSFSETAGRRWVYLVSFVVYTIFNILAAISTSIGMFIVMRFFSGGASASVQAVGAGTVADIWQVKERGRAMGIFYLGPLAGPLIAPVIGGALSQWLGWRSTQWFQVIYGVLMLFGIVFFLPETHHTKPVKLEPTSPPEAVAASTDVERAEPRSSSSTRPTLSRATSVQSINDKSRRFVTLMKRIFIEPLKIARYLRHPPVALTVYYASISFGCLYFLNISVEKTFSAPPYDFSTIEVGLLYVSNSLGYFVTSIFGGKWVDYIMAREARRANRYDVRGKLVYRPEDRMRENAWVGAFMMPAALLWYGWAAEKGVYWFAPICANFFFGMGSMFIFAMATTMLTEFMPRTASNGVALNNFCRNVLSCLGSFVAEPLISAIGNGWSFTILGGIALASCFVIVAMRRWGDKWREEMDKSLN